MFSVVIIIEYSRQITVIHIYIYIYIYNIYIVFRNNKKVFATSEIFSIVLTNYLDCYKNVMLKRALPEPFI